MASGRGCLQCPDAGEGGRAQQDHDPLGFGITATLALFLGLFLTRFVTDPIQGMIATMERAERGLEARVQVKSSDDIGLLARRSIPSCPAERARRRVERYHLNR